MSSNSPYGIRSNGEAHGDVFTRQEVVCAMLDMVGYTAGRDLSEVSIMEPSCGDGAFVMEILRRLSLSARRFHFDANQAAHQQVFFYELDPEKISVALQRIASELPEYTDTAAFIRCCDFLKVDAPMVDIVVGNPPYVRYEQLSAEAIAYYNQHFPTFYYRSDLYVPFYEKTLRLLKPQGRHCFICSNRWMKNKYGLRLRAMVAYSFRLEYIANMESVQPFEEAAQVYTDVVLLSRNHRQQSFRYRKARQLSELSEHNLDISLPSPQGEDWSNVFNEGAQKSWLHHIEDLGLKIGIGLATGADRVFISDRFDGIIESDRLLPAINGKDLRGNRMLWSGLNILNPYKPDGSLIDLDDYPKTKLYLLQHEEKLRKRHVAQKDESRWYRTIDKVHPDLLSKPKILLPDMTANRYVFIDRGRYYPTHNIYYITGASYEQLQVLGALLMSDAVTEQLASVTNCMNGGFVRWQSQHLRKLLIPDIRQIGENDKTQLVYAYQSADYPAINRIAKKLFDIPLPHIDNKYLIRRAYTQLSLFG